MRVVRPVGVALGLTLALVLPPAPGAADEHMPSQREVRDARAAAQDKERDVAAVQADLDAANARLRQSAIDAARATEAWNGARYRLEEARQAAAAAADRAGIARTDVDDQQEVYADALVTSYQLAPELTAVASIVQAEGIGQVVADTTTVQATESALDKRYEGFLAAATLADVASQQASDAEAQAAELQAEARQARDEAQAAADAAAGEAQSIAEQKDGLIRELADLQDISVRLAEQRQSALEEQAAQAAAEAAAQAAEEAAAQQAAEEAAEAEAAEEAEQEQAPPPSEPEPQQPPAPQQPPPPPTPPAPPAPSGGASAAISFARAQIGEPYRWGAAGPDSWDCSGLTMGAWGAGGKSLPHYSVAQYEQSTPLSVGSLRPGDLVFWGSSSSPSSIYHVALYVGGGQIVHAPRTGQDVQEVSMYSWTAPNFYARP